MWSEKWQLPEITKFLPCCHRLVSHFNHSSKLLYLLKEKSKIFITNSIANLVQDVANYKVKLGHLYGPTGA